MRSNVQHYKPPLNVSTTFLISMFSVWSRSQAGAPLLNIPLGSEDLIIFLNVQLQLNSNSLILNITLPPLIRSCLWLKATSLIGTVPVPYQHQLSI